MNLKNFNPLPEGFIRFHGRRKGKAISPLKQSLYDEFMPLLKYESADFFNPNNENILEIGFGGGEHVAGMAKENPEKKYLGAEPFINGVTSLINHLCFKQTPPDNIKIYGDDIRKIYDEFKDETFDEIYLLFPDPWRKKRHKDRRFINEENIISVHRLLKTGKNFIVASDDLTYIDWVDEVMPNFTDKFEMTARLDKAPDGWIQTRYEAKAIKAGRVPIYYFFKKI